MKIQIPTNVRQCGEGTDIHPVYVEDYVITFLRQVIHRNEGQYFAAANRIRRESAEKDRGICLFGKKKIEEGRTLYFIYAAGLESDAGKFPAYEYLGRAYGRDALECVNIKELAEPDTLLGVIDGQQDEISFYIEANGNVNPVRAYFAFYEKNESMQDFLIEWYKKNCIQNVESTNEDAGKDFRQLYYEKQESKHQRRIVSMMYTASLMLLILCCITGISMINQYDKMKHMEQAIEHLTFAMQEKKLPEQNVVYPSENLPVQEETLLRGSTDDAIPAFGQNIIEVFPE